MSKFVVSARKYRPARFDEVVGQQHVSNTLKNALQNDQLAHAFLFCGPRGVGKTTCARILAKVLNCDNLTEDHEACNTCSSCAAFNENASFNITELDAASNNSVEHIRALIEQVRFQPQQGEYKIFIIDEVHMLSQAAFNAFLKTLEEPPSYAIFILATTEKHKIIPTILSRCQIFDFRRIQTADMVSHLKEISEKENIEADENALYVIAQKADGALRDALSIYDKVTSAIPGQENRKLTYELVIENLNVLDYDYFFKIGDALLIEDQTSVLLLLDTIFKAGFEPDIFIEGLAGHIRNLLVCQDEKTLSLLEVNDKLRDRYNEQGKKSPQNWLLTALNICNDCDVNYKMARNKRLHVEIALIKMAYINRAVKLATAPAVTNGSTASQEKKIAAAPTPKVVKEITATPKVVKEQPIAKTDAPATTKEEPTIKASIPVSLKGSSKYTVPKMDSLDDLKNQIVAEAANKMAQPSRLNQENLEAAWVTYTEGLKSPSAKVVMRNAKLKVEDKTILVLVGTQMAKGMIQQELNLMDSLREQLHDNELILRMEIDPTMAPVVEAPKVNRLLTVKEKYEKMVEENPMVREIRKRFDLKMDKES